MKKWILLLLLAVPALGQVGVVPFRSSRVTFADANGVPLAGGCIFSYQGGTTTPQATYTDYTGGTPNTNPVILDSSGSAVMWLGPNTYKFAGWSYGGTNCATGALQWTVDQIPGDAFLNGTISGATIVTPTIMGGTDSGTLISGAVITVSNINSTPIGGTAPAAGSFTSINGAVDAMSFSATPVFAASNYSYFTMTLTANVTSSTITGGNTGQEINLYLCQNGTGGYTFAWPGSVIGAPVVNVAPNACTSATMFYNGANWVTLNSNSALLLGGYDAVTYSATPNFNAGNYSNFTITLAGNVTSSTITGEVEGQIINISVCGTAGYTFTWPVNFINPPAAFAPTPTQCLGVTAITDGAQWFVVGATSYPFLTPDPSTPTVVFTSPATGSLESGSNDSAGAVAVTNLGGGSGATIFTLTFGGTYFVNHWCVISPSATADGLFIKQNGGSESSFIVIDNSTGGSASPTVQVNYLCHP